MEVHGRDSAREAYRVSIVASGERIIGLVPETLIDDRPVLGGPRHQGAHEWFAHHRADIEAALCAKRAGLTVRAPFDRVTLAEDDRDAD